MVKKKKEGLTSQLGRSRNLPGIVAKLSFIHLSVYYYHFFLLALIHFGVFALVQRCLSEDNSEGTQKSSVTTEKHKRVNFPVIWLGLTSGM